jgi:hypothetical protein
MSRLPFRIDHVLRTNAMATDPSPLAPDDDHIAQLAGHGATLLMNRHVARYYLTTRPIGDASIFARRTHDTRLPPTRVPRLLTPKA